MSKEFYKVVDLIYNTLKNNAIAEKYNILLFDDNIIIELKNSEIQINIDEIKY